MANQYGTKCPKCGSPDFVDATRYERCNRCEYEFYYGDAHATGDAQISKCVNEGEDLPRVKEESKERGDGLPPGWEFDDQAFLNGYQGGPDVPPATQTAPAYSLTHFADVVEVLDATGVCVAAFRGESREADAKLYLLAPRLRDALKSLLNDTGYGVFAAGQSEVRAAEAVLLLADVEGK